MYTSVQRHIANGRAIRAAADVYLAEHGFSAVSTSLGDAFEAGLPGEDRRFRIAVAFRVARLMCDRDALQVLFEAQAKASALT